MRPPAYESFDEALEILSAYGPDLANGLTSHAPMAAEALCAMGRSDAVLPWVERYRSGMLPRPAARERIAPADWRAALGQEPRFADWSAFFAEALRNAAWPDVVSDWTGRLVPGFCAAATHGVIRVGHAVRALGCGESPQRVAELADALASWASTYQELPTSERIAATPHRPRAAIREVAVVPAAARRFSGTITSSLEALGEFPPFADVFGLLDVDADPAALIDELTDTFARVAIANSHDLLTAIVFVHGVTGIAALGHLLPHLDAAATRRAIRYAWQTSCALYATFGSRVEPAERIGPPREDVDTLVDMAVAHGDEHAIKFAEACLAAHARAPSPAYPAAARRALDLLQRAED